MAPGHGQDVARAVAGRDASKAVVLLAHQPKTINEAAVAGVDLQLSGHVHAGQIVPFNWLAHLDQPYLEGLHRHGETWIYVSPGTGYWGPPMRVGTTSEITRVVLTNA
jgi:predicted MPP superfamily phosphohydrolase